MGGEGRVGVACGVVECPLPAPGVGVVGLDKIPPGSREEYANPATAEEGRFGNSGIWNKAGENKTDISRCNKVIRFF